MILFGFKLTYDSIYPTASHSATVPSQFFVFFGVSGMLHGCFSCSWEGLRGSWGHLGAQSWIFKDSDGSQVFCCTLRAPHVGVHCVVMLTILRQNLAAFCLLACLEDAVASILMVFGDPRNLTVLKFRQDEISISAFWSMSMLASLLMSKIRPQKAPMRLPGRCEKRCAKEV